MIWLTQQWEVEMMIRCFPLLFVCGLMLQNTDALANSQLDSMQLKSPVDISSHESYPSIETPIDPSDFSREHEAANFNADRCTIPMIDHTAGTHSITHSFNRFVTQYLNKFPVILRGFANDPSLQDITHMTSIDQMKFTLASLSITLATANTYSYDKKSMTFSQYIDQYISQPVSLNQSATDILYWFGDHEEPKSIKTSIRQSIDLSQDPLSNDSLDSLLNQSIYQSIDESDAARMRFQEMLASYPILEHAFVTRPKSDISNQPTEPIKYHSVLDQPLTSRYTARLSFGLGSAYSGTPMHWHSSVFAHLLHGSKRWFLFPPDNGSSIRREQAEGTVKELLVTPELSAIQWVSSIYKRSFDRLTDAGMIECVAVPGDILYIPDEWLHATLNMEPSVFMSAFMLDECATTGNRCDD